MFILDKKHLWALVSLLIIVPIGFYTKFYTGPAAGWVRDSLGGVCYEIFWCLLLFLCVGKRPRAIAAGVFITTCTLEVLQLWRPPFLENVRAGFIGQTLLGATFAWSDFPHYLLGCAIAWLWMEKLDKKPRIINRQSSIVNR